MLAYPLNASYADSEYFLNHKEPYMLSLFAQAWAPQTMAESLLSAAAFGGLGIALAIVGFKLFDWITPGDLGAEITSKQNIAASILAGAVVVGVSIIMAAAIKG